MKVMIFSTDLCPDCVEAKRRLEAAKPDAEISVVDITGSISSLKRFLKLRDTLEVFAPVREKHSVGVPFFLFDDGEQLLDVEAALRKLGI